MSNLWFKSIRIIGILGCFLLLGAHASLAANPAKPKLVSSNYVDFDENVGEMILFLKHLQDQQQPPGLVPIFEYSDPKDAFTTTYSNAMVALAFVIEGELERARQIFDVFKSNTHQCVGCTCEGGFQQFLNPQTGEPLAVNDEARNDFWIGDNAWLLVALKYYKSVTNDNQYDALIDSLATWFTCLENITPADGIYVGYDKQYQLRKEWHSEGHIDVYGALHGLGGEAETAQESILRWINQEVWVPHAGCFRIGNANKYGVPLDNISWGYLSLGNYYQGILYLAQTRLARTQDRYLIEAFDRQVEGEGSNEGDWYWRSDQWDQNDSIEVSLARKQTYKNYDLEVNYSWDENDAWFLIFRERDIDLNVSDQFLYSFRVYGDGSNNRFEVKLYGEPVGTDHRRDVFWHDKINLDFVGWKEFTIPYGEFSDFSPDNKEPLGPITRIEFAVNNSTHKKVTNSVLQIDEIWYRDEGHEYLMPVDGFAAFESELNWLYVEGTAQMATAYYMAEQMNRWEYYMNELGKVITPAFDGQASGLPNFITGGIQQPTPEAVATSWYIIAANGVNPFNSPPSERCTWVNYMPLSVKIKS